MSVLTFSLKLKPVFLLSSRGVSLCAVLLNEYDGSKRPLDGGVLESQKAEVEQSWLSRVLSGPKAKSDTMSQSTSSQLANQEYLYEIQTHRALPGQMDKYLDVYENYIELLKNNVANVDLVGSFQVMIGNQDQAVHIWRYKEGDKGADALIQALHADRDIRQCIQNQGKLCTRRTNVLARTFTFWGDPQSRPASNIYEMRSYVLKPGQMIEWGIHWSKGITFRREFNQDFTGFFSQVGQLYSVFHVWVYKDFETRRKIRNHMWSQPGWDQNVAYTVPLIKEMKSKIMIPNEFSPTQ